MKLQILAGVGNGATKLSAFDSALCSIGLGNFNLIHLSSVIPPASKIVHMETLSDENSYQWGDRAYVVMASKITESPKNAWAGLGWVQDDTGKGLFIEHEGDDEQSVQHLIEQSMETMLRSRPSELFGDVQSKVVGINSGTGYRCALVVATYNIASW